MGTYIRVKTAKIEKMKLFSFFAISCLAQNEWDEDYLEFDAAEFYSNKLQIARNPAARENLKKLDLKCCETLKVWGDIALFSGRIRQKFGNELHFIFRRYCAFFRFGACAMGPSQKRR